MTTERSFIRIPGEDVRYAVRRILTNERTPFQHLEIVETETFGLGLFLDGKPQSAELDEFIYHEALVQPALAAHASPRSVFIAGGAEGATLREALRPTTVERVVMVDIDEAACDFAKDHLAPWHQGAYDDRRVELVHADARGYLEQNADRYDIVIVDITDPLVGGPSYKLFTREFYGLVRQRLNPGGLVAVQAEAVTINNLSAHLAIARTMRDVFRFVRPYSVYVPFFADQWGFVLASDATDPLDLSSAEVDARLRERGSENLRYYDGEIHRGLFALPRFVRAALDEPGPIITDAEPLFVD
ncbi:MAG TPA: fused MFS/spermidine synthase [Chloroflexota bacterium]|nr:fused MFS/spermidine synthase [Chloroflexota bacterium]